MENESRKSRNKTLQKVLLAVLSIILMTGIAFFMANVVHNNSSQPTSSKVKNGLSAYELAVEQGYKGDLNDWLKSLDGKSAFEIAKENGYSGTEKEWNKAVANVSKQNKSVITNAGFNKNGDFILTLLDGTDVNVSNVSNSKGKDGKNGTNGKNGKNGANGKDGRSITLASVNSEGQLVITYSDGSSVNLDKLVGINGIDGKDGTDGKDGVGINTVNITGDGKLNITLTNGTTLNLGTIKGEKGDKGDTGVQGEKGDKGDTGEQGIQGVAGKDGKDGINGINGTDGVDGKDGTNGKDGVGIANVLINTSGELELTFSDGQQINLGNVKGSKGDKGEKGDTGEQGVQGIAGKDGINGTNGVDGKDGTNGKDGTDGQDGVGIANVTVSNEGALSVTLTNGTVLDLGNIKGADGIGISKSEVNASGELVLTYTDGTVKNLGNVVGANGADGQDGVGIKTVTLSSTGELMVTLSDNSVINLGNVKGEKGDKGDKGDAGVQGEKGEKGDKGDTGRGIAKTELVNGELIITYTDGTKENLGSVTSTENTADKYLVYKILTDDSVSVSLKSEYIGDLEGKITIPSEHNGRKVTEIKGFTGCQLSEIELPDTLEIIGPDTFSGCTNLKSITIPKNVYRIQGNAFLNSGLQTAKFENPSNWKKYQVYTYNGYDSTLTSVSSSSLSDETKAAELLTETYNYKNDSSISWKSGTYYFLKH